MIFNVKDDFQSKVVKKIEIEVVNYTLNSSCWRYVNFMNSKDNKISNILVYIDRSDFLERWFTDEDLINKVIEQIVLSKITGRSNN